MRRPAGVRLHAHLRWQRQSQTRLACQPQQLPLQLLGQVGMLGQQFARVNGGQFHLIQGAGLAGGGAVLQRPRQLQRHIAGVHVAGK